MKSFPGFDGIIATSNTLWHVNYLCQYPVLYVDRVTRVVNCLLRIANYEYHMWQLIKSQTAMGRKGGDLWLIYRLFEQGMVNCQDCRHVIWHNWWHVARNRESACIHLLCKSIHISKSGKFMCIYTTSPPNFTTYTHVIAYIKKSLW